MDYLIEFYRGAGNIKLRGGLDERSLVIEISGRREIKVLVSIFDPSYESVQEFVDYLIDSYRRAGIGFDWLDLWVPKDLYATANKEVEEGKAKGDRWASKVTVRSLDRSFAPDLEVKSASKEVRDLQIPRNSQVARSNAIADDAVKSKSSQVARSNQMMPDMRKLVQEVGKGLAEEISRNLGMFIRDLLSSDLKKEDPELIHRLHELERRIELLESFIKILGSYGSVPSFPRPSSQDLSEPVIERLPKQKTGIEREKETTSPKIEENIHNERPHDVMSEGGSAEDVLSEIFNNPWVSILRRKGEDLESESD
jgi:hypothetical protein